MFALQLPGKRGTGQSGWAIQAKLQMYLWLGINKHKKEVLKGLPGGYEDTPALRRSCRIVGTPPPSVKYTGQYKDTLTKFTRPALQILKRIIPQ